MLPPASYLTAFPCHEDYRSKTWGKVLYNNHKRGIQGTLVESGPASERSDSQVAGRQPGATCPPHGTEAPWGGPRGGVWGWEWGKGEGVAEHFREEVVLQDWVYSEYSEEYSRWTSVSKSTEQNNHGNCISWKQKASCGTGVWVSAPEPGPLQGPQGPCPNMLSVTEGQRGRSSCPQEAAWRTGDGERWGQSFKAGKCLTTSSQEAPDSSVV